MKVRLFRFMKPSQTIEVEPGTTLLALLHTLGLHTSRQYDISINGERVATGRLDGSGLFPAGACDQVFALADERRLGVIHVMPDNTGRSFHVGITNVLNAHPYGPNDLVKSDPTLEVE